MAANRECGINRLGLIVRWISNSAEADTFIVSGVQCSSPEPYVPQVFANVDPSKGYKGITCFVMSKDQGVQIAKKESKVRLASWAQAHARSSVSRRPRLANWLSTTSGFRLTVLSEKSARGIR